MILCADDFGLNNSVSTGILNLVHAKKSNSVSCLVTTSNWKKRVPELQLLCDSVELGLHLTLTDPKPVHFPGHSLSSLIRKSYLGQLKKQEIILEIQAQMKIFRETTGRLPDYVDGHEFCHHLPTVREALIEIAEEFHFKENNIYIRVFRQGKLPFFKNSIFWMFNHIISIPSKKLARLLKSRGILFNSCLFGFHPYHLEPKKYFEYYFQAKPSKKDIFFCHPGLLSDDNSDSLRHYRFQIYNFMMSSQFDDMLNHFQVNLSVPLYKHFNDQI